MITEDYVSFEVAKLLKEKGFEILTSKVYDNQKELDYQYVVCWQEERLPYVSAPTLQMAMKWLREEDIIIVVQPEYFDAGTHCSAWSCDIWVSDNYEKLQGDFPSYEETVEAALKYCLKNFI